MSADSLACSPWFAVYVKARHEKSVARALEGKGLTTFLPTHTKIAKSSKKFELPLFPGYVFCRIELPHILPVMMVPGVFSIVGTSRDPQPIPEAEIAGIQNMLASGLTAYPWPYVAAGQEVRLNSGPLRGAKGVVIDSCDSRWLVISVHLLRRSIAVKVDRESLHIGAISASSPQIVQAKRLLA